MYCSSLHLQMSSTIIQVIIKIGAVLGQAATGGRTDLLMEQLTCVQVPSLNSKRLI